MVDAVRPSAPVSHANEVEHRRQIANVVNLINQSTPDHRRTPAEIAADVTVVDYRYPELHLLRYAAGDGETDDTVAIQNAIDVAFHKPFGAIFVPDNDFLASGTLTWRPGVSMYGPTPATFPKYNSGSHLSRARITLKAGSNCRMIEALQSQAIADGAELGDNGLYHWNCVILGVTFDGDGENQTAQNECIFVEDAWSFDVKGNAFQHIRGVVLYLDNVNECEVKDNRSISAAADRPLSHLVLKDSADCKVQENSFFGSEDAVIVLDGATCFKNLIQGNLVGNTLAANSGPYNSKDGLLITNGASANSVLGNRFDQNYGNGINLEDGDSNTVSSNHLIGNGRNNSGTNLAGILVQSNKNVITGNMAKNESGGGNQAYGIYVTGTADENTIVANGLHDNVTAGLLNDSSGLNNITEHNNS